MLMCDMDEDCEQLVLWTPLGSHPSCSKWEKNPDSSHHWLLLSGLDPFPDSRGEGWEASSFRPPPLLSDCSQLLLLSKAKVSFANHLSQCKRGLELKTVEKYKERELAGQSHCKEGSSLSNWVTSSTITWSGPQQDGREGQGVVWVGPVVCDSRPSGSCVCQPWQHLTVGRGCQKCVLLKNRCILWLCSDPQLYRSTLETSGFQWFWPFLGNLFSIWIFLSPSHVCTRPKTAWEY